MSEVMRNSRSVVGALCLSAALMVCGGCGASDSSAVVGQVPRAEVIPEGFLTGGALIDAKVWESPSAMTAEADYAFSGQVADFTAGPAIIEPATKLGVTVDYYALAQVEVEEVYKGSVSPGEVVSVMVHAGVALLPEASGHGFEPPGGRGTDLSEFGELIPEGTRAVVVSWAVGPSDGISTIEHAPGEPRDQLVVQGGHPQSFAVEQVNGAMSGWRRLPQVEPTGPDGTSAHLEPVTYEEMTAGLDAAAETAS